MKTSIDYDFWGRATIPWLLSCEVSLPRGQVYDVASQEADKFDVNYDVVMGVSIFICILAGVTGIAGLFIGFSDTSEDNWHNGPGKCIMAGIVIF